MNRWDIYGLPRFDGLMGVAVLVDVKGPLFEKFNVTE